MTENGTTRLTDRPIFPVLYMFVITFVASGVLIGLGRMTSGRVEANKQVLFERAVLVALGRDAGQKMSAGDVHKVFSEQVHEPTESTAGAYRLIHDDTVLAYALPFEGRGFWNVINGVMGIKPDGRTLTGIAFYEQSETPGLGAEIVKPQFTDQFRGLKLGEDGILLGLKPAGKRTKDNEVDAVTGATQTCTRLERILNEALESWRKKMGFGDSDNEVRESK